MCGGWIIVDFWYHRPLNYVLTYKRIWTVYVLLMGEMFQSYYENLSFFNQYVMSYYVFVLFSHMNFTSYCMILIKWFFCKISGMNMGDNNFAFVIIVLRYISHLLMMWRKPLRINALIWNVDGCSIWSWYCSMCVRLF